MVKPRAWTIKRQARLFRKNHDIVIDTAFSTHAQRDRLISMLSGEGIEIEWNGLTQEQYIKQEYKILSLIDSDEDVLEWLKNDWQLADKVD